MMIVCGYIVKFLEQVECNVRFPFHEGLTQRAQAITQAEHPDIVSGLTQGDAHVVFCLAIQHRRVVDTFVSVRRDQILVRQHQYARLFHTAILYLPLCR